MESTIGMDTRRWRQSAVLSPVQMGPTLCVSNRGLVGIEPTLVGEIGSSTVSVVRHL